MPFRPTQTLAERHTQFIRLFVVEHRFVAVCNAIALHNRVRTETSIFRKGGVIPTVFDKFVAKQETRTLNTAGLV